MRPFHEINQKHPKKSQKHHGCRDGEDRLREKREPRDAVIGIVHDEGRMEIVEVENCKYHIANRKHKETVLVCIFDI